MFLDRHMVEPAALDLLRHRHDRVAGVGTRKYPKRNSRPNSGTAHLPRRPGFSCLDAPQCDRPPGDRSDPGRSQRPAGRLGPRRRGRPVALAGRTARRLERRLVRHPRRWWSAVTSTSSASWTPARGATSGHPQPGPCSRPPIPRRGTTPAPSSVDDDRQRGVRAQAGGARTAGSGPVLVRCARCLGSSPVRSCSSTGGRMSI